MRNIVACVVLVYSVGWKGPFLLAAMILCVNDRRRVTERAEAATRNAQEEFDAKSAWNRWLNPFAQRATRQRQHSIALRLEVDKAVNTILLGGVVLSLVWCGGWMAIVALYFLYTSNEQKERGERR